MDVDPIRWQLEMFDLWGCEKDLDELDDDEIPETEELFEDENLQSLTHISLKGKKGLRARTLRRLVFLMSKLRYEFDSKGDIYRRVFEKEGSGSPKNFGNFLVEIEDEDIQKILDVSERTARDYGNLVRWFGVWFLSL